MVFLREREPDKGYGRIISILILITFIYLWPSCANLWWQYQKKIMEDYGLPISTWFVIYGIIQTFCVTVVTNTFFGICYYFEFEFIEKYAVADEPWPWKVLEREEWKRILKRSLALYTFNVFILGPSMLCLTLFLPYNYDVSDEVPNHKNFILQILFCLLVDDILFYAFHRALHTKVLYKYIHKIHHEYTVPISISAANTHPFEFVLVSVSVFAGPVLLSSHIHTASVLTWFGVKIIAGLEDHCGYEFSWSPYNLQPCDSGYHAYHHLCNMGNYAAYFQIWDSMMGTNKAYYEFLKDQEKSKVS